jgi:hypothetical protein
MRWSRITRKTSLAWVCALRAAALLLNREVCRHVLARRADLSPAHRAHLERACLGAWDEANSLYGPDVWGAEIDEVELKRRATGLATLKWPAGSRKPARPNARPCAEPSRRPDGSSGRLPRPEGRSCLSLEALPQVRASGHRRLWSNRTNRSAVTGQPAAMARMVTLHGARRLGVRL